MDLAGKKELVTKDDSNLSVRRQCKLLNLNRSSVYYKEREESNQEVAFKHMIDQIHTDHLSWGTRRITGRLNELGYAIGRKLVRRFMQEMRIYAIYPKPNLSILNKQHKTYPYLLRHLAIDRPNQVWSIDITYIPMGRSSMYLTAIIDWHSRYILGYELSDTLHVDSVLSCVQKAIARYGAPEILNSDQGSQFTSIAYTDLLKHHGIKISMDGKGRWADNIIIERFFRTLKYDEIYIYHHSTPRELRAGINRFMKSYNEEHPHQAHHYKTPYEIYFGMKVAS